MFTLDITTRKKIFWMFVFGISMGFLECAVVVYLRDIYYPSGFKFPLSPISGKHISVEILREISTVFMLMAIGILSGKRPYERFGWFLMSFGIWDIFYYVFLKMLLNWPDSLLTWDILFLIPVIWTGPVLAPVISSTLLITLGILLVGLNQKQPVKINLKEWVILLTGTIITLLTYVWDYSKFMISRNAFGKIFSSDVDEVMRVSGQYVPDRFLWWLFIIGKVCIIYSMYLLVKRNRLKTR